MGTQLLVFMSAAVLAAVVAGTSGRWPAAAAGALSVRSPGITSARSQQTEETLQLIVSDSGFEPTQVTRRVGKFLLTADDHRSDKTQQLTLRLSSEGGEHLRDIKVPEGVADWAEEIDLSAGKYVLAVVGRFDWTCRIEITAQ